MELQVVTADHTLVTFIKAKKETGNSFLQTLGFGSGNIRTLDLGRDVKVGGVSMGHHLFSKHASYLMYSGQQLFEKCGKTQYIINPMIVYCGEGELKEIQPTAKTDV